MELELVVVPQWEAELEEGLQGTIVRIIRQSAISYTHVLPVL